MTAIDVVLVDDEPHLRLACSQTLELAGLAVECHADARSATARLGAGWAGVLVSDVRMPGEDGLSLMARALDIDPDLPVVLITGHGDIAMAVQAMRDGAYDFLEKPFAPERLLATVRRALERRRLVLENRRLSASLANASGIERAFVGRSDAMIGLRERILAFAGVDADVLILGETGTGKERAARCLHESSRRAGGRFVPIDCGALPASIIESELFGHEAGAFTGAQRTRIGKFEYCDGGTLFLDEIESMPLELQSRLLRVLQERRVVRLGSNEERAVDVRVVAATKRDLAQASAEGAFRLDLFYRLAVLTLDLPPLRARREDVAPLFAHFLERAAQRQGRAAPSLNAADLARLAAHSWPGNVRELENVATRYALGLGVDLGRGERGAEAASGPEPAASLASLLVEQERLILERTLSDCGGSLKRTYERLGISRKTLYDKLRRHGLRTARDGEAEGEDAAD